MPPIITTLLAYGALPAILAVLGYLMKSPLTRIEVLEKAMHEKVSDDEMRQHVDDKISPIHEDVKDLKSKIDQIITILLSK